MAQAHAASTRRILVVSHTSRTEAIDATRAVFAALNAAGITPVMAPSDRAEFAGHLDRSASLELGAEVPAADLEIAIVLGGDGTILRAAELVRDTGCPIVGVNLGHVGFLAESERHDLDITVQRVLARDYTVEERMTLAVRVSHNGDAVFETWALNEATVEKGERMLELIIGVDGRPLTSYGCDGVVLSTPTGSTAYAFSAGGPVVWPGVDAMLLVPLSAHTLFNRALVVGPESSLTVEVDPRTIGNGELWCDGRRHCTLPPGAIVQVHRDPQPVLLARLRDAPFTDRLVNKFHLPVEGWRGAKAAALAEAAAELDPETKAGTE